MAGSYRRVDREQGFLLPPDMRQWLPSDHLAFFVLDVVDRLDTSGFHAKRRVGGVGRRGYDPDMLLAVLVYSYMVGQRSSRQIERLCTTDVAFRVLCAQDVPDHTRVSRFRQENEQLFEGVFEQVLTICAQAGMGQVGVVAIDGTKIAANASPGARRTQAWLREELAELQAAARAKARSIIAEAEQVDAAEDDLFGEGVRGDELPVELADPGRRAAAIEAALEQIEAAKKAEQAQARAKDQAAQEWLDSVRAGIIPRGNTPLSLDRVEVEQSKIEIYRRRAADMTLTREQRKGYAKAVRHAETRLAALLEARDGDGDQPCDQEPGTPGGSSDAASDGKGYRANLTDPQSRTMKTRHGWIEGYNTQVAVTDDHLILAVDVTQDVNDQGSLEPMLDAAVAAVDLLERAQGLLEDQRTGIGVALFDAGYFSESNLAYPGPERLIADGRRRALERAVEDKPVSGPPPSDASVKDAMRHRLRTPLLARLYKRRSATVEPVIGQLKDVIGLRRFSRRGLAAAHSEVTLAAAALNLRKLHTQLTIA